MFVIDNDFGALGTVTYLLHRQPLAEHARLLLPRRAYEMHASTLPVACHPYDSLADILAFVEREPPDLVFLYSGYLLAFQRLLTVGELGRLVATLRARGCRVATSDPFLGTFREVAAADVPRPEGSLQGMLPAPLAAFVHRKRVELHVRRAERILAAATHVYPVAADVLEPGGAKRASFFNPHYIRTPDELRDISAAVSALPGERAGEARWLFVLAQFDLGFQEKRYGKEGFVDRVAAKIREALELGKHPAFIGPAAMAQALSARFAGNPRVTLRSYCAFAEFEQRLFDAEAAFYWQFFSTSALLRSWNGLPTYFLDPGHVPRLLGSLHAAGLESYYMGATPVTVDIDRPLDPAWMAQLAPRFRDSALEAREKLSRLPGPAEMVEAILGAAQDAFSSGRRP